MDRLLGASRLSRTRSFRFRDTKEIEQEELARGRSELTSAWFIIVSGYPTSRVINQTQARPVFGFRF
jgi:hypothetical protein